MSSFCRVPPGVSDPLVVLRSPLYAGDTLRSGITFVDLDQAAQAIGVTRAKLWRAFMASHKHRNRPWASTRVYRVDLAFIRDLEAGALVYTLDVDPSHPEYYNWPRLSPPTWYKAETWQQQLLPPGTELKPWTPS